MFGKKDKETLTPDSQIFAIYDSKTESYGEPIFGLNGPDMIRRISNAFLKREQQESNPHWLNAEDFSLFQIGEYDKSSGKIVGQTIPTHVANFHELRSMIERKQQAETAKIWQGRTELKDGTTFTSRSDQ